MRSMWLFRSNLRILEPYHHYTNLEDFKKNCHDFYLMQCIWFLENNFFDEIVIWRLKPKKSYLLNLHFSVDGKPFVQKFVDNFEDIFKKGLAKKSPNISFFRGGFPEYCSLTKKYSSNLGLKLYCGTGRRVYPQYGGVYDKILIEDERDINDNYECLPFFKTACPNTFRYSQETKQKIYDICFISNFTQQMYKGQEFFIKQVSESKLLKRLRIVHIGNKPEVGIKLCTRYKVTNIHFLGKLERADINNILSQSKFGLVCSNQQDGCPRVVTEVLSCGVPLLVRDQTRLLRFYKKEKFGVVVFSDKNISSRIKEAFGVKNQRDLTKNAVNNLENISMDETCRLNIKMWQKNKS